ncbi:MAG TPA: SRPBCC domain-containing protein, partial [Flavisolibacter sp.]|nr:SRPBCC domain-containing protein [Flavisolibacter sp.]
MVQHQDLAEPLVKEVILDAPASRVWQALTDKDELKQWCFEMEAFKPEEEFEFQFYGEKDGDKFLHLCKVLEVEVEKKMKWLWSYENVPGDTYVTFELFPQGDKTKL